MQPINVTDNLEIELFEENSANKLKNAIKQWKRDNLDSIIHEIFYSTAIGGAGTHYHSTINTSFSCLIFYKK